MLLINRRSGNFGKVELRIAVGSITVDGVAKGASPPTMQLSLPPGTHTIVIQNPAGPPVTKTVMSGGQR